MSNALVPGTVFSLMATTGACFRRKVNRHKVANAHDFSDERAKKMTLPKAQAARVATPEPCWHCLAELALPTPCADVALALNAIHDAWQGCGVLTGDQARLRRALGEAVLRASARNGPQRAVSTVLVRLLLLQGPAPLITAAPDSTPPTARWSTATASALPTEPALRGWGFFLVEHNLSESCEASKEAHYVIELFLYPASAEIAHEPPSAA